MAGRCPEVRRLIAVKDAEMRWQSDTEWSPLGIRWWRLTLHCGHTVDRAITYRPVGQHRPGETTVRPAPRRARCHNCPDLRR